MPQAKRNTGQRSAAIHRADSRAGFSAGQLHKPLKNCRHGSPDWAGGLPRRVQTPAAGEWAGNAAGKIQKTKKAQRNRSLPQRGAIPLCLRLAGPKSRTRKLAAVNTANQRGQFNDRFSQRVRQIFLSSSTFSLGLGKIKVQNLKGQVTEELSQWRGRKTR